MLKDKEGDPEAGDNIIATKAPATARPKGSDAVDKGAGTLFIKKVIATADVALPAAADAAKAVGAVSGADILRAVTTEAEGGKAVLLAKNNDANNKAADAEKAGVMIGNVAREATAKVLETLTMGIKRTINEGLGKIATAAKGT